jgi:retron-type reverse transcriptase
MATPAGAGQVRRVGHLFKQITDFHSLIAAARRAAKGKRISNETAAFLLDLEPRVLQLRRELREGCYQPGGYRTFMICDPKVRVISAAPFRDRVVHHAICTALEPIFERYAISDSYACRVGKGTHAALLKAQQLAGRYPWFLKLDIERFFERLDHDLLREQLARQVKDRRFLGVVDRFIEAGAPGSPSGKGVPIGNLTSQHFANFYLGPLDHYLKGDLHLKGYCRYMDDVLVFGPTRSLLDEALQRIEQFLNERLLLELKQRATVRAPVSAGVPFLGWRIWPVLMRLDARRVRRLRRQLRDLHHMVTSGEMTDEEAALSAQSLVAWAEFGQTLRLRQSLMTRLDEGLS